MKTYSASTNIKATPETIWQIITDAPNYPAWDPWAIRIEGTIAPGETIKAYTKLSPERAFPAKVTGFVPHQSMAWSGGMPLGLFKGVRTFSLKLQDDGSVNFTVREDFSGPLLPLFGCRLAGARRDGSPTNCWRTGWAFGRDGSASLRGMVRLTAHGFFSASVSELSR